MEAEILRNYLHRQLADAQKEVDLRESKKDTLYYVAKANVVELEIALAELNNLINFYNSFKEDEDDQFE